MPSEKKKKKRKEKNKKKKAKKKHNCFVTVIVILLVPIWTYMCSKCLSKPVHSTCLANVHKAFPFRCKFSIPMCGDIPRLLFLVRNGRNLNSISRAPYYEGELYYALFGRYR